MIAEKASRMNLKPLAFPIQKIYRLDAIRHPLGHIGCGQSHIKAIDTAIMQGWGNILIIEDDMVFNKDSASEKRLNEFLQMLGSVNWYCALLSAHYLQVVTCASSDWLVKPRYTLSACAYAVNADYRVTLRDCFQGAVDQLLAGGEKYLYAIDVAWLGLMQRDDWFGMYPVAGHQAIGESDIENKVVDYMKLFYKDLAAISA